MFQPDACSSAWLNNAFNVQKYPLSKLILKRSYDVTVGVSLDIENYCTLRLFFNLSTL
ncbi:hypothetical protein GRL19_004414 [Salmonella enterica]|nr:hypothetical protein [Salmonella enterica]